MKQSKKEPFLGQKGQSDPSVQGEGGSGKEGIAKKLCDHEFIKLMQEKLAKIEAGDFVPTVRKRKVAARRVPRKLVVMPDRSYEIFRDEQVSQDLLDIFYSAYDVYREIERLYLLRIKDYPTEENKGAGAIWKAFIHHPFEEWKPAFQVTEVLEYQNALANYLIETEGCLAIPEFYYEATISDCFAVIDGLAIDFEFKTNVSDYLNDFYKSMRICELPVNKHIALAHGLLMISKHYFVVPDGMLTPDHMPEHSGLITFTPVENPYDHPVAFTVLKEAPILNGPNERKDLWKWVAAGLMRKLTVPHNGSINNITLTNKI